jgi:4-hydroxybenzoate polyprenyltransferase
LSSASIRMKGDLRSQLRAVVALARPATVLPFVSLVTLLGADVGGARSGELVLIVWLANVLAVTFAFMVNDVEDAADDALVPAKAVRNPISAGRLSPRAGYGAAAVVGVTAMVLYATLGLWPLAFGGLCLVLGILYSWRRVRLKAIPVADLVSHTMMLAALQFLCAYAAFQPRGLTWLVPCLSVVAVSAYGQLTNQLRDLDSDRQAGINHTTARVGRRVAEILMVAMVVVAAAGLLLMVWMEIVPLWVMALFAALTTVMVLGTARRSSLPGSLPGSVAAMSPDDIEHRDAVLHVPVMASGTIALLAWLITG